MTPQKTILIIDDEPHLQEGLTAALAERGFAAKNAYDGEVGLRMAVETNPDVVVLDLILPKKDGFKVLRQIKSGEETKHIPVIVLSNLESSENVELVVRLGANSYLAKQNYTTQGIVEKIKAVLAAENARAAPH
jgi:DNA-binding response OmpR family regulator